MKAPLGWGLVIAPALLCAALLFCLEGEPGRGPAPAAAPRAVPQEAERDLSLDEATGAEGLYGLRGRGHGAAGFREQDPREARIRAAYARYLSAEDAPARAAAIEEVAEERSQGARMLWARQAVEPELTEEHRQALLWSLATTRGGPRPLVGPEPSPDSNGASGLARRATPR